jgi:hypothetical protein
MNLENSFWPAFLNYPVGWVKERRDEPTVSKAMGIAESILRDVEGLNPSYMARHCDAARLSLSHSSSSPQSSQQLARLVRC